MKDITTSRDTFYSGYDNAIRFSSYYHQIELVRRLSPARILEVGIGNKTVSNYLRQQGIDVTTCDYDGSLGPDHVADIRNLPFEDGEFDLVMACEILEHLPWDDLPVALEQLARVTSRYALISLPYLSVYFEMVLRFPMLGRILKSRCLDICIRLPFLFRKCSKSHHWEIGMRGYPIGRIRKALRTKFRIVREVRPMLNPKQHFFVLEKE